MTRYARYWGCPQCDSIIRHKGLCRDCTEYDEDGKIVNPVPRVRVNADGSQYTPPERVDLPVVSERNGFRKRKKLSKKQQKMLETQLRSHVENQSMDESGFVQFGESDDVGTEEE